MPKRPWVIKAGGELMGSSPVRRKILRDLKSIGRSHPVVFIHGGGPQIEAELVKNKVPVKFVGGRRFTSEAALSIIESVLSGAINKNLVGDLLSLGVPAVGLSCRDGNLIVAEPLPHLGRAGKPVRVDPKIVIALLKDGFLPVLSSIGADKRGRAININADDAASALAVSLKARHLFFLTNIPPP